MKLTFKAGSTSNILQVFIRDYTSSTGGGLTGLTNGSSGLTAYYHKDGDTTATAISLVTMTVGTFTSGGFKEIDATNMPGWYQFCPPDAALASAKSCAFHLKGAANMATLPIEVALVAYDPQDSVHLGLTSLPNATAGATNGLPLAVDSSGRVDVLKINGTSQTARDIGASVLLSAGSGTGQLDFTSGIVKSNLTQILGTLLTETSGQIAAAFKQFFNIASPTSTMNLLTAVTTVGSVTGAVGSVTGSVGSVAGNVSGSVASVAAGVTVTTNNDKTGYGISASAVQAIWDALTSALTTVGSIGKLLVDKIDATISSRSTYAGGDTSGTTSLLGRLTSGRASNLDNLDAAISTRSTYAGTDTSGTATLLGRLTSTRAGNLDSLDATVSSRLASASYTAPDNADILLIKAKTDNLPASPAAVSDIPTASVISDAVWDEPLAGHLTAGTTGNALNGAGASGDPWGTLVPGAYGAGTAGNILGTNLDAAVSSISGGSSIVGSLVSGDKLMQRIRLDFSSTNVNGVTWVSLGAVSSRVRSATISDSSGQATKIGISPDNGSGAPLVTPSLVLDIPPDYTGIQKCRLDKGMVLWILCQSASALADTGELDIGLYY